MTQGPRTFSRWLRGLVPETLRSGGFLLEPWQWLALLALALLGVILGVEFAFPTQTLYLHQA